MLPLYRLSLSLALFFSLHRLETPIPEWAETETEGARGGTIPLPTTHLRRACPRRFASLTPLVGQVPWAGGSRAPKWPPFSELDWSGLNWLQHWADWAAAQVSPSWLVPFSPCRPSRLGWVADTGRSVLGWALVCWAPAAAHFSLLHTHTHTHFCPCCLFPTESLGRPTVQVGGTWASYSGSRRILGGQWRSRATAGEIHTCGTLDCLPGMEGRCHETCAWEDLYVKGRVGLHCIRAVALLLVGLGRRLGCLLTLTSVAVTSDWWSAATWESFSLSRKNGIERACQSVDRLTEVMTL